MQSSQFRKRESGSALMIVMLLMTLMGLIGLAALDAVTRDQRVANYHKRQKIAFHAAEAGVSAAYNALLSTQNPTFAAGSVGDTSIHPSGVPTYSLDTISGASTTDLGLGAFPGMNLVISQNGAAKFTMRYWRTRVKGEAPGGTLARIEFVAGRVVTN